MKAPADYIMIIEDVRDERDAAQILLEIEGYRVIPVASVEQALAHMRTVELLPRMILLDLMMHGTNGWEFRTEQLRDPRLASIPVVVCSGDGRLAEKASALGKLSHLEKPIDSAALLALVARHYDVSGNAAA